MARLLPLSTAAALNLRLWLWAAAVVLAIGGCSDPVEQENDRLRNEIIAVHDEAMN